MAKRTSKETTYARITQDELARIQARLENGDKTAPWRMPWFQPFMAQSGIGGFYTNLINQLVTAGTAVDRGYTHSIWLTYNFISNALVEDGVVEAEKIADFMREYFTGKSVVIAGSNPSRKRVEEVQPDGSVKLVPAYWYMAGKFVINLDEFPAEAIAASKTLSALASKHEVKQPEPRNVVPHEAAEAFVANYIASQGIRETNSHQASYDSRSDILSMPLQEMFKSDAEFYLTYIHEIAHSTGHTSRLDNTQICGGSFTGRNKQLKELSVEVAAQVISQLLGLDISGAVDNSDAYLLGWISAFEADDQLLPEALDNASKIVDFMSPYITVALDSVEVTKVVTHVAPEFKTGDTVSIMDSDNAWRDVRVVGKSKRGVSVLFREEVTVKGGRTYKAGQVVHNMSTNRFRQSA